MLIKITKVQTYIEYLRSYLDKRIFIIIPV